MFSATIPPIQYAPVMFTAAMIAGYIGAAVECTSCLFLEGDNDILYYNTINPAFLEAAPRIPPIP